MQHSYEVNDGTGAEVRASMNDALKALSTVSAGDIAPLATNAYMLWYDTANKKLMRRDADNANWDDVEMGSTFDPTALNKSIEVIQEAVDVLQEKLENIDISSVNAAIAALQIAVKNLQSGSGGEEVDLSGINASIVSLQSAVKNLQDNAGSGGISLSDVFTSDDWLAIEGGFEDLSSRMGDISTALTEIIGEAI